VAGPGSVFEESGFCLEPETIGPDGAFVIHDP